MHLPKVTGRPEPVLLRQRHVTKPYSLIYVALIYAANRARPLLRRALITLRPFLVRILARKPDTLLRLREVPPRVRLVMKVSPGTVLLKSDVLASSSGAYLSSLVNWPIPGLI